VYSIPVVDVYDTAYHRAALKNLRTDIIIQQNGMYCNFTFRVPGVKMHGNKKLCWIFLGKCTVVWYEFLTTKKPPNLAMRGLFVWLIIQLVELNLALKALVLEFELLLADESFES